MSSYKTEYKSTLGQQSSKFCKVCFDAGKEESIYKSHYVKNNTTSSGLALSTCPTLLKQTCRYCHKHGHTLKYCKALIDKEKRKNKKQRQYEYKNNTKSY